MCCHFSLTEFYIVMCSVYKRKMKFDGSMSRKCNVTNTYKPGAEQTQRNVSSLSNKIDSQTADCETKNILPMAIVWLFVYVYSLKVP